MVFLENGHVLIDNNPAENAIRSNVIGRKNWLFSVSEAGAQVNTSALFFIIRAYRTTVDLFNGIGTASLLNNTSSVLKELYHLYTLFDYKLTPSILFLNFFKNQRL